MNDTPAGPLHIPPPGDPPRGANDLGPAVKFEERLSNLHYADDVIRSGYHPVLLFGSAESGKSTILVSLLNALARNDQQIHCSFGKRIFSETDPEEEAFYERARGFYERYTANFAKGVLLPQTVADKPFMIPIRVAPAHGPEVSFAFVEGSGEWLDPLPGETGARIRALKPEIADLLRHFGRSISIIYVAPYSVGEGRRENTDQSDENLAGAISKYAELREAPANDQHLFLLTKWDVHASPLARRDLFARPEDHQVDGQLRQRFPFSWGAYRQLPLSGSGRRAFMQFVAGNIKGGMVRLPEDGLEAEFDRYPQTVWNWLYGNAVDAQRGVTGPAAPLLFRDVTPPVVKTSWLARIVALLTGRSAARS